MLANGRDKISSCGTFASLSNLRIALRTCSDKAPKLWIKSRKLSTRYPPSFPTNRPITEMPMLVEGVAVDEVAARGVETVGLAIVQIAGGETVATDDRVP